MVDNVDVTEELKQKNQEMLYSKKKVDLDKSMESLMTFFKLHSLNTADIINNKICTDQNINIDSEEAKIYHNTIVTFFNMTSEKLKEIIDKELDVIANKLDTMTDEEYSNALKKLALSIKNQMLDFFVGASIDNDDRGSIDMLANELCQNTDMETKSKIYKYLYEIISIKMLNVLKDNLMISIQLIGNNNKENQEVIERINERTLQNHV